MKNKKGTKKKRLLSIFLTVLAAVSILPMSWFQASAATENRDDDRILEETIDETDAMDPVSMELKNNSDQIKERVTFKEARNTIYDYSVKAFDVKHHEFQPSEVTITYAIESAEKDDRSEEAENAKRDDDSEKIENAKKDDDSEETENAEKNDDSEGTKNVENEDRLEETEREDKETISEGSETGNRSADLEKIATIDENGQLQILEEGGGHSIYVIATAELKDTCSEKSNYVFTTKKTRLDIVQTEDLLQFEENGNTVVFKEHVFGTNDGMISDLSASKDEKDNGSITYRATVEEENAESYGMVINSESGKLCISDYENLANQLVDHNGALTVKVSAHKTAGTKFVGKDSESWEEKELYAEADAAYFVKIRFETTPENSFLLKSSEKTDAEQIAPNAEGWFHQPVYVIPAEGYQIACEWKTDANKTLNARSCVVFNDQGERERIVYLKNTMTGGITAPIKTGIGKIDSVKPDAEDIEITYSTPDRLSDVVSHNLLNKIIHYNYYDRTGVTVTITAKDATSGIKALNWTYTRAADASDSNLEQVSGTLANIEKVEKQASGTLTDIENQVGGILTDVEEIEKDGDKKVYQATLQLPVASEDQLNGNLQIQAVDAADLSSDYITDTDNIIIVDSISPKLDASYSFENATEHYLKVEETVDHEKAYHHYTSEDVTVLLKVKEANFFAEDVKITVNKTDVSNHKSEEKFDGSALKWEKLTDANATEEDDDRDWYQAKYTFSEEGDYVITLQDTDHSGNMEEKVYTSDVITIDKTAPTAVTIAYSENYSKAAELADRVLEKVTGKKYFYYKSKVTLTFKAQDAVSGVDHFTWSYAKEANAGAVNKNTDDSEYTLQKVTAVQSQEHPEQFFAEVVLPREKADQLRGNFIYAATDKCGNEIEKPIADNENVIVVDTRVPTMTAAYTIPSREAGSHWYYNKNIDLTLAVTEANFYAEDVKVELSRNAGRTYTGITPTWTGKSADLHIGTYTIPAWKDHSNDADYRIRVTYEDRSGNVMKEYVSNIMTIDTKAPVISVSYANQDVKNKSADAEGHDRSYYNAAQTATVTIDEHNFAENEVDYTIIAKDVTGKVLDADALCQKSGWTDRGDIHTMTITYPGDANYTFSVAYTDLAANQSADYNEDYFTVDKTAPSDLNVTYSPSMLDIALNGTSYGFYREKVRVTLTARDEISGVYDFNYAYTNAAGVSAVNAELINQSMEEAEITYSNDGCMATAAFEIPGNALLNDTQFNGTIQFTAKDRSDNESNELADTKRVVVDNIAPTANVGVSAPVYQENGISYYDGAVTATIIMNEANFYPEDVVVTVTKDGAAYSVSPSWNDQSTDIHVGTFMLSEDGDYFITMNYRDRSGNQMVEYSSQQLTVDTEIIAPVITVNSEDANGRAFKNEVVPAVTFHDINFDSYNITLTRTRYDVKEEDVTETYIGNAVVLDGQGGNGSFDTFEKEAETDGIYTMTVSMTDKAGHSAETTATFTVNRFGSVYVYNDQLTDLIKDGGAYVQPSAIKEDLVITEYNADRLLSDSLNIEILCDGKPLSDTSYSVTPEINEQAPVGSSGWYQYQYTIAKENFIKDGIYKIAVASKDATGNSPETTNYEDKAILFHVDGTSPEITSIAGLEDSIINAQRVDATYSVYDTMGLKSIQVLVDGTVVDEITDFSADRNNYEGDFVVSERRDKQKVELIVTDLAGNVTDTDSEEFKEACAYAFHDVVTISTNAAVRVMAWVRDHAKMIAGTVAVAAAIAAGVIALVLVRRRKEQE